MAANTLLSSLACWIRTPRERFVSSAMATCGSLCPEVGINDRGALARFVPAVPAVTLMTGNRHLAREPRLAVQCDLQAVGNRHARFRRIVVDDQLAIALKIQPVADVGGVG